MHLFRIAVNMYTLIYRFSYDKQGCVTAGGFAWRPTPIWGIDKPTLTKKKKTSIDPLYGLSLILVVETCFMNYRDS